MAPRDFRLCRDFLKVKTICLSSPSRRAKCDPSQPAQFYEISWLSRSFCCCTTKLCIARYIWAGSSQRSNLGVRGTTLHMDESINQVSWKVKSGTMCQWGKLENGKCRIIWLGLWLTLFTWTDGGAIAFLDIGTRTGASPVEWRWIRAQSSPFLSSTTARVWLTRWRALRPRRPRRPTSVDCSKVKKKRKIKHTKWLIWLIGSFINRIWYPIEKWMEVQSESKTQFWPTCHPVGPCSIRHLQHVFILCIDFKRESKDDSDSGRMKEFRIKAAHQAKKIEKKCEKKRTFYFLLPYTRR